MEQINLMNFFKKSGGITISSRLFTTSNLQESKFHSRNHKHCNLTLYTTQYLFQNLYHNMIPW